MNPSSRDGQLETLNDIAASIRGRAVDQSGPMLES